MSEELDLDSIREHMANDCLSHILDCQEHNIVMHFVINSFAGSGKSTSIMKAIDKAGYTWLYLAPTHRVIDENLEYSRLRDYDFIHLKGKNQEGVCLADDYRELLNKGVSITPFCETRCIYRHNGCPYYETKEEIESFPQSWAGVHAHFPTYLQTFFFGTEYDKKLMYHYYDVIIIDEFPFQVLFNQEVVNREDIDNLRDVVNMMEETTERDFVMEFLNELTLATSEIGIRYSKIEELIDKYQRLQLHDFQEEYNTLLLRLISNKVIDYPPKNLIFNISLIYSDKPTRDKLKWMIYKQKWDGWSRPGIYITTSNVKYFKNIPIPIIALDATADIKAWNALLNDNCKQEKIDIIYKNMYQLRSKGRYPVSTWITIEDNKKKLSDSGIRLCNLIIEICKRKNNAVLICSNKRIKRMISQYLSKNYDRSNYEFAIYYDLRGRNEYYEKCDTCIIAHEPNIPPLQLDIMENVIGWDRELLRNLMTYSEILQAIGRIRQNILVTPNGRIRENIEIYVLPGTLEEDKKVVEEAKIIPYNNMYVGELNSLKRSIEKIIKKMGTTTISKLSDVTGKLCSKRTLRKELMRLWKEDKISDYKRSIKWCCPDEEDDKTQFRREFKDLII